MKKLDRRLFPVLSRDLQEKMVLLAGPRQCGKTTLARAVLDAMGGAYFSWDVPAHRKALRAQALPEYARLWARARGACEHT